MDCTYPLPCQVGVNNLYLYQIKIIFLFRNIQPDRCNLQITINESTIMETLEDFQDILENGFQKLINMHKNGVSPSALHAFIGLLPRII